MKRLTRRLILPITVAVALLVATSAVAGAGDWIEPHTWGSSEVLGYGHVTAGDNVAFWQLIQHSHYGGWCGYADGCTNKIDGHFGPITHDYTVFWQTQMQALVPSLAADGIVGPQSWNASRFFFLKNPYPISTGTIYTYNPTDPNTAFAVEYSSYFTAWLTQNGKCGSLGVLIGSPHISTA